LIGVNYCKRIIKILFPTKNQHLGGLAIVKRVKLRVGIALAFSIAMVPLTLVMVGYLYWSNAKLIVQSTSNVMQRSTAIISKDIQNLFFPVVQLLQSASEIVRTDQGTLKKVKASVFSINS
jgi:adenylate cyclase